MTENGGGGVNGRLDRIESILERTVVLADQVANESKQLLKAQVSAIGSRSRINRSKNSNR